MLVERDCRTADGKSKLTANPSQIGALFRPLPNDALSRCVNMAHDEILRAAYEAGLACGRSIAGLPAECPFDNMKGLAERIAWLSGFSVGKAVRVTER
jgi:hypothetical protein